MIKQKHAKAYKSSIKR